MTTTVDLLAELRELDVRVSLDGDRLRLNAPVGALTDEHKRKLAQRKQEVIDFLREAQRLAGQQHAIVPLQPNGTRTPIFAVAGHNGDVFAYRAMAEQLGPDQPLFGLQPPGLEAGSEPLSSVPELASYFAAQIRAFQPTGPISIAGYCAGGTIAFELARQLASSGVPVTNLMLFGAPYCRSYRRPQQAMASVRYLVGRSVVHARRLCAIPAAERRRYLGQRVDHVVDQANQLIDQIPRLRQLRQRHEKVTEQVFIRRGAVEDATLAAARAYAPKATSVHIDFLLPCPSWRRSSAHPLRWSRFTTSSASFSGPEGCRNDIMLLPENVATFAALVLQAQGGVT